MLSRQMALVRRLTVSWLPWAVLLTGAALFARTYAARWDARFDDFESLWVAAQQLEQGEVDRLYEHHPGLFDVVSSTNPRHPFVAFPGVAFATRALLPLGFSTAGRLLLVLNALSALAGCLALARWQRLPVTPLGAGLLLLYLSAFEPLRYAAELGQTTPLVFAAVALAVSTRSAPVAGCALAFAAAIKVTPLVFAVLFLAERRWRVLAWCAGALALACGVSVACVGASAHLAFLQTLQRVSAAGLPALNNQSLAAFGLRFGLPLRQVFNGRVYPLPPVARALLAAALAGGAAGVLALYRWRGPHRRYELSAALLTLVALTVTTISWSHYYLLALIPLAVLGTGCLRESALRPLSVPLGFAALLLLHPIAQGPVDVHGNLFANAHLGAAALLFAVALWQLRAPGATP